MSEKTKAIGTGAIITAILIFTMTGVFGWIGITTAEVPALKKQATIEFAHIKDTLNVLAESVISTNKEIRSYSEDVRDLSETLVAYGIEIRELKKDCSTTEQKLNKCERFHMETLKKDNK